MDIIVQFRTSKPKPSDHPDLETLKEWIDIEATKAQQQNAEEIAKTEQEIMALEVHLASLKQTYNGLQYLSEYERLTQQLTVKKPLLAVTLK